MTNTTTKQFKHEHNLKHFDYQVKADASVKENGATHYFRIRPIVKKEIDGKVVGVRLQERFTRKFKSFYTDTQHAELYSVERALIKCKEAGISNVLVRVDNENIVKYLVKQHKLSAKSKKYLERNPSFKRDLEVVARLLKQVNGTIAFNPRDLNKGADKGCSHLWDDLNLSINIGYVKNKPRRVNFNRKARGAKNINRKCK